MMTTEFINRANAQGMTVERMSFKVLSLLDENQQELYLAGKCICCQETDSAAYGVFDTSCDDEGNVFSTCVGYGQELFCEGCEDNLPAEVLLKYEVISQYEYDELCSLDDYYEADDKSHEYVMTEYSPMMREEDSLHDLYLSIHPDASIPFDEWRKSLTEDLVREMRRQYGVDDDDLPF